VPFWQSGQPVGMVWEGVGSGDVVGGRADVVSGSDSVCPESDTVMLSDAERESEMVSSWDGVTSLDLVGVPADPDTVWESDGEVLNDTDADVETVADVDSDVVKEKL
jgi:hypothetical protein